MIKIENLRVLKAFFRIFLYVELTAQEICSQEENENLGQTPMMSSGFFSGRNRKLLPLVLYIAFGIWIILLGILIGSVTNWDVKEMLPLGIPALVIGPLIICISVFTKLRWLISVVAWLHLLISLVLSPLAIPAAWINTGAEKALLLNGLYVLLFILFPIAIIVTRHFDRKALVRSRWSPDKK